MQDITIIHGKRKMQTTINISSVVVVNLKKGIVKAEFRKLYDTKISQTKYKRVINIHEIKDVCEAFHKKQEVKKEVKPEAIILSNFRTQSLSGFGIGPLNNNLKEMGPAPTANIKTQKFLKVTDLTKKINLFFKIP